MTQPLFTADQRAQLLANGQARASGRNLDPLPVVRLFALDAHATWLLASLDPAAGDTAYGLIDLGYARPGYREAVRSGIHRRTAQAAHRARPAFHCDAHAVRLCAAGTHQRIDHRLIDLHGPLQRAIQTQAVAAHCVFLGLTQDRVGLNRHSCT